MIAGPRDGDAPRMRSVFGCVSARGRLASAFVALLALAAPQAAHAGGFGSPEMGPRRTAMAAVVGRPDDPSAVFHNPAGLVLQSGTHVFVSLGGASLSTAFRIKPWAHSDEFIDAPVDSEGYYPTTKPSLSYGAIPMIVGTHEVLPGKLFVGLSLYVLNAIGSKFDEGEVSRYHLIEGYIVAPVLSATVAYNVNDWLAVGASAGLLYATLKGERDFFPYVQLNGEEVNLSLLFGSKSRLSIEGSAFGFAWNAGALFRPLPWLTAGVAITGRSAPTMEGDIELIYGDDAPNPGSGLYGTQHTQQLIPWTFLAGVNVDVLPELELGLEGRMWKYDEYDEQVTKIDDIALLTELRTPKNFRNAYQIAGGVHVHDLAAIPEWAFMAGFHYDRAPAPANTITLDQPSFSHAGTHTGVMYKTGRWKFGLTWAHYWYLIPDTNDSITQPPLNYSAKGQNNIVTLSVDAAFDP